MPRMPRDIEKDTKALRMYSRLACSALHELNNLAPAVARTELIYWLLRAYQSGHREGWEDTPSTDETMDGLLHVLANYGYDPSSPQASALLKIGPL